LIIVTSSNEANIEIAYNDLNDIIKVTTSWDAKWVSNFTDSIFDNDSILFSIHFIDSCSEQFPQQMEIPVRVSKYVFDFNMPYQIYPPDMLEPQHPLHDTLWELYNKLKDTDYAPKTLIEFQHFWNKLDSINNYHHISEIGDQCLLSSAKIDSFICNKCSTSYSVKKEWEPFAAIASVGFSSDKKGYYDSLVNTPCWPYEYNSYIYSDFWPSLCIPAKTEVKELSFDLRELFSKKYAMNWYDLDFNLMFSELSTYIDLYGDLSLQKLQEIIRAEKIESRQNLIIFGMNLNAKIASLWGIILIFCVLFYFFLHLRNFLPKLAKEGVSAQHIPWIGLYSDMLSKLVIIITLVLLPIYVLIQLVIMHFELRNISISNPLVWSAWTWVLTICGLLAVLVDHTKGLEIDIFLNSKCMITS
jgi:hypothetical protein